MYCEHCKKEYENDVKFCSECGAELTEKTVEEAVEENTAAPAEETSAVEGAAAAAAEPTAELTASQGVPGYCPKCGAAVAANQMFCYHCGQTISQALVPGGRKKKKLKWVMVAVIAVVAIAAAVIVGFSISSANHAKAVKEYVDQAVQFADEILLTGAKLEDVAEEINQCWYDYVFNNGYYYKKYDSPDDAVATALSNQVINVSTVKMNKLSIDELYGALLVAPDQNDKKLVDIENAVYSVYSAYGDYYNYTLSPTGNYTTFKTKSNSYNDSFFDEYQALRNLLDKYKK